ncbi:hypothetical protein ACSBR2_004430 [Camellia fascicularis]
MVVGMLSTTLDIWTVESKLVLEPFEMHGWHCDGERPSTVDEVGVEEGRGSYDDRTEMLRLIVDLVEVAKDIQLIDAIAEKQAQIFSEECKLFPADVQIQSIYPL